jgi:hypothetical protein
MPCPIQAGFSGAENGPPRLLYQNRVSGVNIVPCRVVTFFGPAHQSNPECDFLPWSVSLAPAVVFLL